MGRVPVGPRSFFASAAVPGGCALKQHTLARARVARAWGCARVVAGCV